VNTPRTDWESFYGLHDRPFSLTPDLRFAFASASHTRALHEVTEALQRREGVVVVTGEVGTGKTMLCRTLLTTFERRTFLSVISDPLVTVEELLTHVLTDFGLITPAEARGPMDDATRHKLVLTLQQFLASLIPLNAQAVILIDEAQHLSPAVLEEIRLLANFETDEAKLLQIVLVGQPALDRVLARPDLRQLSQRIARRCALEPLTEAEVRDYVERRLAVATEVSQNETNAAKDSDARTAAVEFSRDALTAVATISQGVPRVVNTLCDRALQAGFERQIPIIDRRAVLEGAQYLRLHVPVGQQLASKRVWVPAAVVALVAAAAVGIWWLYFTPGSSSSPTSGVTEQRIAPPPAENGSGSTPAATGTTPSAPATVAAPIAPAATVRRDDSALPIGSAPAAARPSAPAAATASGTYEISVAAFRTTQRAQQVAGELSDTKLPVLIRPDGTGSWQLVIVGPFRTAAEAEAARVTLVAQGFSDARVLNNTPAPAR
jgi:general secretion pathway protein A